MPFQVSISTYRVPRGIIQYATAGADQVIACGTQIMLQASVIGDTTGHTFEWSGPLSSNTIGVVVTDQTYTSIRPSNTISGGWSGLTLYYKNNADPHLAGYVVGATFDDKIWRFWIDRGTPFQTYYDVVIYGTPTDVCYTGTSEPLYRTPRCEYTESNSDDYASRIPKLTLLRGFSSTNSDAVDFNGTNNNIGLYWNTPTLKNSIIQYEVQRKYPNSEVWGVQYVYGVGINHAYGLTVGCIYRVVAITRERNSTIAYFKSNEIFIDPNPDSNTNYKYYNISNSIAYTSNSSGYNRSNIPTYNVSINKLKTLESAIDYQDDSTTISNVNGFGMPKMLNYSTTQFTLKTFEAPLDFNDDIAGTTYGKDNSPRIFGYTVTIYTGTAVGG